MSSGKKFETNFKNSVPENIFYYRFRDGTSSWGNKACEGCPKNKQLTRFQAKNICDCQLFDGDYLYLLELKSTKGKSLSLNNIRKNQVDDLMAASEYANIVAGLVVNFADAEQTYFMEIDLVNYWYYEQTERKSIPIKEFKEKCIEIQSKKLKVNYRYDIHGFIKDCIRRLI